MVGIVATIFKGKKEMTNNNLSQQVLLFHHCNWESGFFIYLTKPIFPCCAFIIFANNQITRH